MGPVRCHDLGTTGLRGEDGGPGWGLSTARAGACRSAYDTEIRKIICTTNAIVTSTPDSAVRPTPAATSPTTKPRSKYSTSPCSASTPPAKAANAGPTDGKPR
jgi:hypothetical protein